MEYGNEGLSVYSIQTSHISKAMFLISVSQNGMKSLCKQRQHHMTDATIYIFLAFHYFFPGIGNKNIINRNFSDHHFL